MKMDTLRMRVRLDMLDNEELMLKPESVCLHFPTPALKLQEQLLKLHDLAHERIASSKKAHRIQIKVTDVKHVDIAIACQTLGAVYLATGRSS